MWGRARKASIEKVSLESWKRRVKERDVVREGQEDQWTERLESIILSNMCRNCKQLDR